MLGYFSSTDIIGRERDIALSRLESRNLGKEWFQVLLAYEIGLVKVLEQAPLVWKSLQMSLKIERKNRRSGRY